MLSRFVRVQLVVFAIASLVASVAMVFGYLQVPRLLGVGHLTVTLELPSSGGLYRFSNVTYRGVQVGKVTDVEVVDGRRVVATLSLDSSPKIPSSVAVQIRSVSAIGEQYVDLQPPNSDPPFLVDGSVLTVDEESLPQPVGPLLDAASSLVASVPKGAISSLLDESFKAFDGAGYDLGSLIDSTATLSEDLSSVGDQTRILIDDSAPLLDGQAASTDSLRVWTSRLAAVSQQIVDDDQQVRTIVQRGPGFAAEVSDLLEEVKPTLPLLLANLTSLGQVGVTYHPSLEQLLVLLPPNVATIQATVPSNNPTGIALGDFAVTLGDPPPCTVGFLPPSQWRSPEDTSDIDTPDGLYCKLPQDSPIAVRGARNYPCMSNPGKRAPTVELCNSDKPFEPLAMRQHALGPYPFDPNLVSQGVPLDSRVDSEGVYTPSEGTPPPLTGQQVPGVPVPGVVPQPATPSAHSSTPEDAPPPVAFANYDPATGTYISDGRMHKQADLVSGTGPRTLDEMLLP
ncbi:MlaD family protein [Mycobacterium sp. 236(2023)]|uniref:MCE family protein n=1 Tax=Mycobacterium sp. 236(2023) TaxID=3038163 RepID=UPI0024154918|nr:MlaD family protein [Mycobacterium sp. 236(2023)]MDG4667919.1 MlaD family protein [Mycobacterium sp. 236(2023)]